ncbi:ROK family transcriptional regulator [Cellulomonas sp. PhB143]|uniref:ROK family transcriptional regulator n=1 Tax=Cellulomonas sp. PhB143 TaxID=2485186 RepID=UPI000F49E808|nr:ROK family transcriptional regulator [Cellulomonas sp. PhB143]ROS75469.1 putative NBD/HSP70 family sugar kinase [Cellulomonas sp. PhB143]
MIFGPGDVLDLVRDGRATTRGEIAQITGLSRVTVAQRVDALLEARLVEGIGTGDATGGRRPVRLAFNADAGRTGVAVVETAHAEVAVTDLAGTIRGRELLDVDVADGPEVTLRRVSVALAALLGRDADRPLLGVGVSLPSPIDPCSSRPSEPPILPGWDAFPVAGHVAEQLGRPEVPVVVRNDADVMAYGEFSRLAERPRSLFLLKVSTGIGAGMVFDGRIFQGDDGAAGDIGHVRVPQAEGVRCQCGATGCLAAVASGRAVARQLRDRGHAVHSGRDVQALLAQGDPDAVRLTREAGRTIGGVVATAITLVNPGLLLLSGDLASPALLSGVRESLYPATLPRATRHLGVHLGHLGGDGSLVGIAGQVVQQELSPQSVNERLA